MLNTKNTTMKTLYLFLTLFFMLNNAKSQKAEVDQEYENRYLSVQIDSAYQEKLDSTEYYWSDNKASVLYSMKQIDKNYRIQLNYNPNNWGDLEIHIIKNKQKLFSINGHEETVFVIGDNILYYAIFSPISNGCTIAAYDLNEQKELWETRLKGIGLIEHSKYRNRINIEINSEVITVIGKEASGDYIEIVDRKTGKTIANRRYQE